MSPVFLIYDITLCRQSERQYTGLRSLVSYDSGDSISKSSLHALSLEDRIERIGLPDAGFAAKGLNKTDNFTRSLSAVNHTCEELMIALLGRGPPYRSCLRPRNMRVSARAGRGEIDFSNTLSAVRKL